MNNFNNRSTFLQKVSLLLLFLMSFTITRSQDDDANEEHPIEFSYTTKTFNKVLPFDQFFSIKLTNLPSSVTSVKIQITEYDVNQKFPKGTTITPAHLKNSAILFETEEWNRPTGSTDNTAEIAVPFMLKPNRKFIIGILSSQKSPLSTGEKIALSDALKKDPEITNIINEVFHNYRKRPDPIPAYSALNITQDRLNDIAKRAVSRFNRDYQVTGIDPAVQLFELTQFVDDLVNVMDALQTLTNHSVVSNDSNSTAIKQEISNFRTKLSNVNWGNITAADADFTALTNTKDAVFSSFFAPLPPTISSIKQRMEDFLQQVLTHRDLLLKTIAENTIAANTFKHTTVDATYRADFVKNAKLYVSLDVGTAYVGRMDRVLAYSGANIYFRPVNRNIPLGQYTKRKDWLAVRTSLLVGITLTSFERENVRKGLIGNSALLLGAGIRPIPFLKFNGGVMAYNTFDPNPLKSRDNYNTTLSGFFSISIDLDAKPLFGGIGEALFK